MTKPLQFGLAKTDLDYEERRAAFGIAARDGLIACVRITRSHDSTYLDLPGGALDAGETEEQALIREFGEETGLIVQVDDQIARVQQYFVKADGRPVNNRGGVYEVAVVGEDPRLKIEDDHALVWCDPVEALAELRHGSHAYAVVVWLNSRRAAEAETAKPARRPRKGKAEGDGANP